ncbi:MAG: hypothetical protein R2779_00885 [Crocinitomicaceae bacterium]
MGTNKGYISRIENNIKDIRLSTLQKIIEKGFGGHLELSIKLWLTQETNRIDEK